MIFIEWWIIRRLAILLSIVGITSASIWFVRSRRKLIRVTVTAVAAPIGVLAGLFLALQVFAGGCLTYSVPVYSPDHTRAARVRIDDEGATGGHSSVEIFWNHGFSTEEAYSGGWKTVDSSDIRWTSNNSIEIVHAYPTYRCQSTDTIAVRCISRSERH